MLPKTLMANNTGREGGMNARMGGTRAETAKHKEYELERTHDPSPWRARAVRRPSGELIAYAASVRIARQIVEQDLKG